MVKNNSFFFALAVLVLSATTWHCGSDTNFAVLTATANANDANSTNSASTTPNANTTSSINTNSTTTTTNTNASSANTVAGTVVDGTLVLSPTIEVGPFWVDEMLNRSAVTSDPTTNTSQLGVDLALNVFVHEAKGNTSSPLAGCTVDIWQANAMGVYSDESSENTSGQKWLRGSQVTDASGRVSFSTIVPGWYSGRTPHIHFRLRKTTDSSTFNWTTQAFVSDVLTKAVYSQSPYSSHPSQDTFTTNDRLYQSKCKEGSTTFLCGDLLLLQTSQTSMGYQGNLHLYVDSVTNG